MALFGGLFFSFQAQAILCNDSAPALEKNHPDFKKCSRHCELDNDCVLVDQCTSDISVSKKYLDNFPVNNCKPDKLRCAKPVCLNHFCSVATDKCAPKKGPTIFSPK